MSTGLRIACKTWLIVKAKHYVKVEELFVDTCKNITVSEAKHLGAAVGNRSFVALMSRVKFQGGVNSLKR